MSDRIKFVLTVHGLTILLFVLFSVNSLCSAIYAALAGAQWSAIDGQTKFLIVIAILGNWTGLLMAFFRQALSNLAKGKPVISDTETRPPVQQ